MVDHGDRIPTRDIVLNFMGNRTGLHARSRVRRSLEAAGIDPVKRREHGEPTDVILYDRRGNRRGSVYAHSNNT
ncbi:hypothetical protein [Natrinema sp. H-ect4]|uniref:hypothetical protein n=1 Tax=Natrinema sp. H-ect4 TaxID=3242699 RepID=UPI0035A82EDF